jgi:eukaryotic-like serine/threonine-protein kinase
MARQVPENEIKSALGPFDSLIPIGGLSGSGEAWRARKGNDELTIKVIVHEHEPGRFAREVAALKLLNSPRLMRIVSDGVLTVGGTDYPYLISEFVPGRSVREELARGVPSDDGLKAFLVQLLTGLEELKAVQIVHRDLKPENVVLRNGRWEEPVIIDLGLSRLINASSLTVYPWAGGTWPYMAPEQLQAERAIHQTDLWAIAILAAELAAGAHPFLRPGETSPPADWDQRLRAGIPVPGARPAALRDFVSAAGDYRAYRRPTAERARQSIEADWV